MKDFVVFGMERLEHGKFYRSFQVLAALLAFTALVIEFSLDLSKEPFWRSILLGVDVVLVIGFASYLLQDALRHRQRFLKWLMDERINVIILALAFSVLSVPRLAAAIVIARMLVKTMFNALDTPLGRRIVANVHLRPSQTLALSFLGIIAVGTFLLIFPAATVDGKGANFFDALFTITSAACVVGLSVVDIGTHFTRFGQGIILMTIQVGGLGIMVLSAAFAVMLGAQLHSRQHASLGKIFDVSTAKGLMSLIRAVATGTFVAEFFGALLLLLGWGREFSSFGERVWWSVFHSVSAFCNAGFGLSSDNLIPWVNSPWVCGVIMLLITIGGIGFFVIADLTDPQNWVVLRPSAVWDRLHMQTKVVLIATLLLDGVGMVTFLFLEYNGVLSNLAIGAKINAALFHAVSPRTAGFNVVAMSAIGPTTLLFCVIWMFVGASPGSTGGGIKTTTLAVSIMAFRAMLTGREDVELMGRRLPSVIVNRSLSIILVSAVVIMLFLMLLVNTQPLPLDKLLFEAVSAFGTVGLSMDITPKLNASGRVFIIILMFVGRIGPLTMALAIGESVRPKGYRFAEGRVAVG